jgi:drug/metabolite transporter (DMT)-like permease
MSYLIFAFFAATCFAIGQIINKLLSKHSIDNPDSLMAYFMIATFSFSLFLSPFVPLTLPSLPILGLVALTTLIFLVGYYCFFVGVFDADASSIAPIFQMQAALVGLLAFVFLGERFPLSNYLWMSILILGGILVSFDERMSPKSFLRRGIILILLMQLLHATTNLCVGFILKELSALQLVFWENLIIGLLSLVFIAVKRPRLDYEPKIIAPMFLSSYIASVGVLSLFQAFSQNLTISSIIGLLSAPMVFVVSVIASRLSPTFLEHHSSNVYLVRGFGLLIILLGVYKIMVGS